MNAETQAVLFNAAPLLTVAALYRRGWRSRLVARAWGARVVRDCAGPRGRDRGRGLGSRTAPDLTREPMGTPGLSQHARSTRPSRCRRRERFACSWTSSAGAFELDLANLALIEDDGLRRG